MILKVHYRVVAFINIFRDFFKYIFARGVFPSGYIVYAVLKILIEFVKGIIYETLFVCYFNSIA